MIRAAILAAPLLLVTAAAHAHCSVTATPVNFGIYLPFSATPTDSTGSVKVDCVVGVGDYTVALSVGGGGTFAGRRMSSGGARLSYQLYSTASRSTVWGDGTAGTVIVSGDCPPGCETSFTVYGRIPTKQAAVPGTYIDTIVATVTF